MGLRRLQDEFESAFERASLPLQDLPEISFAPVSVLLAGNLLDEAAVAVGAYLKERFAVSLHVHATPEALSGGGVQKAEAAGFLPSETAVDSDTALALQVRKAKSRLAVIPAPESPGVRAPGFSVLLEKGNVPVLVLRKPLEEPKRLFMRVLHALTGDLGRIGPFAHSFRLVEPGGELLLLHAIPESEVQDVCGALRLSLDAETREPIAVIRDLQVNAERSLRAMKAAARGEPFELRYRLAVGDILDMVRTTLSGGDFGLVVVGRRTEGRAHLDAAEYQLLHEIKSHPVLAL